MVTADHGGHDRSHGTMMPEDMTIPLFLKGSRFTPGKVIESANIIDIAPTIAELLHVERNADWEGKSLL
jgi:arylsulfatase A-like enzyme